MNHIVYVGGLSYSGKSTFCREIAQTDPRFRHIELDAIFDSLTQYPGTAMEATRIIDPALYQIITEKYRAICNPAGQFSIFAGEMSSDPKNAKMLSNLLQGCSIFEACDMIRNMEYGVPLVDTLLLDRESRKNVLGRFNSLLRKDFEKFRRTLLFFDFGLDLSLERTRIGRSNYRSITYSEEQVREFHRRKQLPSKKEAGNLDVIIVRTEADIAAAKAHILSFQ